MIDFLLAKMGYAKGEKLLFLNKRIAGLWLVWIGIVIGVGTIFGGSYLLNPVIFIIGYGFGMAFIIRSPSIRRKLSYGSSTAFQNRIANLAILLMFFLMSLFSGQYFATLNFRMIWLGALLATAIHFIPFAIVHGKTFLYLSIPLAAIALIGIFDTSVFFTWIGITDGAIKALFGIALLNSKNPNASSMNQTGNLSNF